MYKLLQARNNFNKIENKKNNHINPSNIKKQNAPMDDAVPSGGKMDPSVGNAEEIKKPMEGFIKKPKKKYISINF